MLMCHDVSSAKTRPKNLTTAGPGVSFSSRSHGAFLLDSWNVIKNLCS